VLHIDERSSNNRASNLKLGTHIENYTAPGYLEYCRNRTGENSTTAKARRNKDSEWLKKLKQVDMFDSTMENAE
jgi:hypothetical protein